MISTYSYVMRAQVAMELPRVVNGHEDRPTHDKMVEAYKRMRETYPTGSIYVEMIQHCYGNEEWQWWVNKRATFEPGDKILRKSFH